MNINNLFKKYKDKVILDIENISFEEGKIIAIIGPNGSGKTTLGKVLSNIIDNDKKTDKFFDFKISYMPQKCFAFDGSVLNNLLINSKEKDLAFEYADRLKIFNLLSQNAKKLSGGELSKVSLIRTLLNKDKLVILDEPTAAMDIESLLVSEDIIKEYNKKYNCTILLITHSFAQVKRIADYVYFLDKGIIIEKGTPKEIESSNNELVKRFISLFSK